MTAPDGWTRVDTHVKVLDDRVVARAKARGIDVLVYAPHFTRLPTIRRRATAYSDEDLLVVPAREVFTGDWRTRRHVLALGLERPVPDFITLAGAMAEFARQDAVVIAVHPEFLNLGLTEAQVARYRDTVDAVETYNPKQCGRNDRRGRAIARSVGLPRTGSSYAHLHRTAGSGWTAFPREIADLGDLLSVLREPETPTEWGPRRVAHRTGPGPRLEGMAERSHLLWENSYGKVDRVLLSGTEPTHPHHVAYEGRFDDVAVY